MNSLLITKNIIRRIMKEIGPLSFIFLFPAVAAILSSLMFSGAKTMDIGVTNLASQDYGLVSFIDENPEYNVILVDESEIEKLVKKKEIKFGIILPEKIDGVEKIQLIGVKESEDIQILKGTIDAYLGAALTGAKLPQNKEMPQNDSGKLQSKSAMGMIAMFIIMFIGQGMQLLLEDKRSKTFMRTFCSPLKEHEMVCGHLLANMLLGMLQIAVFLLVSTLIFKFDFGTSLLNVFIILAVYLTAAVGLGIGIVGFTSDSGKYNMVVTIIAVISSFLGGCFFPLEYMSDIFKKLSYITPQKWLIDAYTKLADGRGLVEINIELLIIVLFGFVLFTFGVKTLRPAPEDM